MSQNFVYDVQRMQGLLSDGHLYVVYVFALVYILRKELGSEMSINV